MKYDVINKSLFVKNRRNFIEKMKPKSIAFFNSNDLIATIKASVPEFRFKAFLDLNILSLKNQIAKSLKMQL